MHAHKCAFMTFMKAHLSDSQTVIKSEIAYNTNFQILIISCANPDGLVALVVE